MLITKVLLGALGCVPAYDEYFSAAVKKYGVTSGTFSINSIKKLLSFYINHEGSFESARNTMMIDGKIRYPQMKFPDMAFWQMGQKAAS